MLLTLSLATLATALQSDAPEVRRQTETHVVVRGAGDGPGGHARLDRNADGFVSREEFVAPLADAFARLDKDGDGRLSAEELAARPAGGPGEVMIFDGGEDGDGPRRFTLRRPGGGAEGGSRVIVAPRAPGRVAIEERIARGPGEVLILRGDGDEEAGARRFTLRRSGDGDGAPRAPRVIVLPEGAAAPRITGIGADLPDLDADGDGRVSEAEFLARFRDAFRRMDRDGSGHLEAGERDNVQVHVFQHRREGAGED